jgi:ABC-type sugar transport system ATPase subunit
LAPRGLAGVQADRAFAERVAAQAGRSVSEERSAAGQGDRVVALDHVNLTIPDGQTLSVVGPSGCGKSTLLRVVAGLDKEYTGEIHYGGRDVRDVEPKDRYIGMVFQNYALYPHFEGEGNLRFFFWVHHAPDAEAEERIRATAEIMGFGFNQLLGRKPGTLSGGQQQRLAIGRALVRNPRLFLFDEPLSNLDAKLRAQTRVEIKRLLHRFRITTIYVTHDQEEAIALGDRIAVMRVGRIEQVGSHAELHDEPTNAFVAGFLGRHPMNLLIGTVGAGGQFDLAGLALSLPPGVGARFRPGQGLVVGSRPEAACVLGPGRPAPAGLRLTGEVEMVEPDFVRRSQMVFFKVAGQSVRFVAFLEEGWFKPGEQVEVAFPEERLYFFDTVSGARLR